MKLNPNWSKRMKEITLEELERELMEVEICEHICIGSGLVYIPCIWTVNAIPLLNRESFGLYNRPFRWYTGHPLLSV